MTVCIPAKLISKKSTFLFIQICKTCSQNYLFTGLTVYSGVQHAKCFFNDAIIPPSAIFPTTFRIPSSISPNMNQVISLYFSVITVFRMVNFEAWYSWMLKFLSLIEDRMFMRSLWGIHKLQLPKLSVLCLGLKAALYISTWKGKFLPLVRNHARIIIYLSQLSA